VISQRAPQIWRYEKAWGPDHTLTLDIVNDLGILCADQGKRDEAEKIHQRALQGYEEAWSPDHTSVFSTNPRANWTRPRRQALQGYKTVLGQENVARYRPVNTILNLGDLFAAQASGQDTRERVLAFRY